MAAVRSTDIFFSRKRSVFDTNLGKRSPPPAGAYQEPSPLADGVAFCVNEKIGTQNELLQYPSNRKNGKCVCIAFSVTFASPSNRALQQLLADDRTGEAHMARCPYCCSNTLRKALQVPSECLSSSDRLSFLFVVSFACAEATNWRIGGFRTITMRRASMNARSHRRPHANTTFIRYSMGSLSWDYDDLTNQPFKIS